jgi:Glycosyl transferase family 2
MHNILIAAGKRPTLSGCVLTRNSEQRLKPLLNLLSTFCDEIVVGVDGASNDRTLEVACSNADKVFSFQHSGTLAGARMLPFKYATSDWLFSIDDDEGLEADFGQLLHSIMELPITHAWFMRKWIVNTNPSRFLSDEPWFPDWQLRLFRNDSSLVRKPTSPHSGYKVVGPAHREERAALLHFEPMLIDEDQRAKKLQNYLKQGAHPDSAIQYAPKDLEREVSITSLPAISPVSAAIKRASYDVDVQNVRVPQPLGWGCEFTIISHAREVPTMLRVYAEVEVRNTGTLSWMPPNIHRPTNLGISFHILRPNGSMLQFENIRFIIDRLVRPGEVFKLYCWLDNFPTSGEYILEWDMVSDGECWFVQCGSQTKQTSLSVRVK